MTVTFDTPIRLHAPRARARDPLRLNLFAGRALGEREFERLQAYADDRIEPLLATLGAGIVQGLELGTDGAGRELRLHVQPGVGVAGTGTLVRLAQALTQRWADLADQAERDADLPLADGLYRLTLRHAVQAIDDATPDEPATRTEPDPLREAYLESVTLLGLNPVTTSPRWLAWPRERAANRLLARHVERPPYEADDATVSIGLVKVVARLPVWVDALAARWLAGPASGARALLEHTLQVLHTRQREWDRDRQRAEALKVALPPPTTLDALLGIDRLPAATPLPSRLLPDPAAPRPSPAFLPADMQLELAPVPASAMSGVLESELARGTISIVPGARERVRLLIAVADADYRPDLMDLPARDAAIQDRVFRLGRAARLAYVAWRREWQRLYRGGSAEGLRSVAAPAFIDSDKAPPEAEAVHPELVRPSDCPSVPITDAARPSLLEQLEAERHAIRDTEDLLEESFKLLNEVNDYLGLQRHQFDALAASFSSLAGGAPGDGSGAKTMRWVSQLKFVAKS